MRIFSLPKVILACAVALSACGGDGTGVDTGGNSIAIQSGDAQFGVRSAALADPLQVIVTDAAHRAKQGVQVQWSVIEGSGATLTTTTSTTDSHGVASTTLTLGPQLGNYRVQATLQKLIGSPAKFMARAVDAPAITALSTGSANAGDTITINGQNFSPTADENTVLFGGFRGKVVTATATTLRAVVPLCVPSRTVTVRVMLGAVGSVQSPSLTVTGTTASALQLARGEVRAFTDPNELACFRLPGDTPGLALILIPQNYSEVVGTVTTVEVTGLTGSSSSAFANPVTLLTSEDAASLWEMHLRRSEQEMLRGPFALLRPQMSAAATCGSAPQIGERCDYQVLNKDNKFQTVTAEVKFVSTHAVVLQDVNAPGNGLTSADFASLAGLFDDPIYNTDVATFGAPSDLDSNGHVLILLTPVVNALTDRGTPGFIAGFFYGCDLLDRAACSGTNRAEIFYAMTADPNGQFSDARSRGTVMASLPPVLAHEFQHMINFNQRNHTTDALWLSEGLAHLAEDVVADVFEQRGDGATAAVFRAQNTNRANRFLRVPGTSLVAEEDVGTLEQRGAAYLFTKYLQGRFGTQVLQKLTQTSLSSVTNVTTQTGTSWSTLMSDWAVALFADDNTADLSGVTIAPEHTFPNVNLRTRFSTGGTYPLQPTFFNFQDFTLLTSLPASSQAYLRVEAGGSTPPPLNLTFSGQRGGAFATSAAPQMTIMRVK